MTSMKARTRAGLVKELELPARLHPRRELISQGMAGPNHGYELFSTSQELKRLLAARITRHRTASRWVKCIKRTPSTLEDVWFGLKDKN